MNSKNNPISKSSKINSLLKLRDNAKTPLSSGERIRVALTMGDPAGIGPAITLKALQLLKNKADITVVGNSFVLEKCAGLLRSKFFPQKLISLNNLEKNNFEFGKVNPANGGASIEYLDAALGLIEDKKVDCVVTCPISKEAINLAGKKFSGHTEYFAEKTRSKNPVMMLLNDKLKFSLLTRHIPIKDVSSKLSIGALKENILNTEKGLKELFLINHPRIVVCGVNPHASDNGLIGREEREILIPAIREIKKKKGAPLLFGPLPADVAISHAANGAFDCIIAAYHDQALIALKLTGDDRGVNLTLGLEFVRTSPLHGTAFDIAGCPSKANPNSLISAIKLAIKCASRAIRNYERIG